MAMAPKPYLGVVALLAVVISTSIISLSFAEEQNELLNDPRLADILDMVQGGQSSGQHELLKFNSMKPQEDVDATVAVPEVEEDDEEGSEKEEEERGEFDPVVQARFKQLEAALKGLTAPEVDSHEELDIQSLPLSGEGARGSDVIALLHQYARDLHKHQGDENAEIEDGEIVNESDEDRDDEEHGNVEEGNVGAQGGVDEENDAEPDPLVQARFAQLEEALKSLNTQRVDSHDELDTHGTPLNADGMKGADVIDLLHKYAQDLHQKLQENGEIESSHDHEESDHHHHHHEHGHTNVESTIQHEAHEHQYEHAGHSHCSHSHDHHGHHDHHEHHDHHDHHDHKHEESNVKKKFRLPEEIAEEEDLMQYGFERKEVFSGSEHLSWLGKQDLGIWLRAMGCSLLVSLASLVCLMLLPFIVSKGKPSETVVNALAAFGAGAMLGDALLHQLPHAFGSSGSPPHSHDAHQHSHDHGHSHGHHHGHGHGQSPAEGHGHAHSLQDLSVGLAVLGGILLFFVVEKIVRRYEELSIHSRWGHSHHHQKKKKMSKELEISQKIAESEDASGSDSKDTKLLESKSSDVKKRSKGGKKKDSGVSTAIEKPNQLKQHGESGGFVIGYLNLFSDAVHNFTDGMALGSAFLLHGTVGGWSRTLFLLAHEIPQEVGDFGILVKSGFSVFEALAFNFLSALVALAGTAMALMLGGSSGHSSLIEGFIAGGFIYMSVGGVMPSMHDQGNSLSSTLAQLVPMILGMGIAVVISLSE